MKTQRILGILWMALCGVPGIIVLLDLLHKRSLTGVLSSPRFDLAALLCTLCLAGAVIGFSLFRGVERARRLVSVIAVLIVTATIAEFVAYGPIVICGGVAVFAIVSIVLLFLPRRDPVA
jgi:hypothetical protein